MSLVIGRRPLLHGEFMQINKNATGIMVAVNSVVRRFGYTTTVLETVRMAPVGSDFGGRREALSPCLHRA